MRLCLLASTLVASLTKIAIGASVVCMVWVLSVVNALSRSLHVKVNRSRKQYSMAFAAGEVSDALKAQSTSKPNGTTVEFYPDKQFFESEIVDIARLRNFIEAKAVLCPGLKILFASARAHRTRTMVLSRRHARILSRAHSIANGSSR